jgi:hypothetical protein
MVWQLLKMLNILSNFTPRSIKILYTNVYSSIIYGTKKWRWSKCLSNDEWVNKIWCIHITEYYLTIKNEVLAWCWWLTPEILALGKLRSGGSQFQASSGIARSHLNRNKLGKVASVSSQWWWEAWNRRIVVQASRGKKWDTISKIIRAKRSGGVAQVVEHLNSWPSCFSLPSTGITGLCHHAWLKYGFLNSHHKSCKSWWIYINKIMDFLKKK